MTDSDPILRMRDITKDFSGVRALDEVSLEVARGEVHAICGENGAGKSTLMKVLSGVYPHGTYSGTIELNGEEATFRDINSSEAAGIVIIHQELALNPLQSIAENIFLGNERAQARRHQLGPHRHRGERAAGQGRAGREPGDQDLRDRRRQAAAGRDRQGHGQGRLPADPRRAHRRPQRRRLRPPARPDRRHARPRHHLHPDLAQAARGPPDRRPRDRDPRRQDRSRPSTCPSRAPPRDASSRRWSAAS